MLSIILQHNALSFRIFICYLLKEFLQYYLDIHFELYITIHKSIILANYVGQEVLKFLTRLRSNFPHCSSIQSSRSLFVHTFSFVSSRTKIKSKSFGAGLLSPFGLYHFKSMIQRQPTSEFHLEFIQPIWFLPFLPPPAILCILRVQRMFLIFLQCPEI